MATVRRKILLLSAAAVLTASAGACGGADRGLPTPQAGTAVTPAAPTRTNTPDAPTALPTAAPTATPTITLTATATQTPTLAPDAWQSMPVIPTPGEAARRIYGAGLALKNDPHAFSILGDCLSLPYNLFGEMGKGPHHYNLGGYTFLEGAVEWFSDSFGRYGITRVNGFTTAAVLSPLMANRKFCEPDENPMACEYRVHRPSFAFIALGTDDYKSTPEAFEQRMRTIVDYTISKGIVPILATKADDREGNHAFNRIVARLAYEYDVPLWNFWLAVQPLAKHGVLNDQGHLTWADPNHLEYTYSMQVAVPVRNVTALQTLTAVWRGTAAG